MKFLQKYLNASVHVLVPMKWLLVIHSMISKGSNCDCGSGTSDYYQMI